MPIELTPASRLKPVWLAINEQGKIIGKAEHAELIRELHAYVERMDRGIETQWPPISALNGVKCRFEALFPPGWAQVPTVT